MSDEVEYELSSGNLWADAGRPDAEEAFLRAKLMTKLTKLIRESGLTQAKAAQLLGTTQPTVSDMMRGKLYLFSLERLITFLKAFGYDVDIVVTPRETDSVAGEKSRAVG